MNKNTRTAEVLNNGIWESINFIDIKKGMLFRIFEPNKELVIHNKQSIWEAISDAYYNEDGIGTVDVNQGKGGIIKSFNCPDCLIYDTFYDPCIKCERKESQFAQPYYAPNITPWYDNICRGCPVHPINGGNGHCNCSLGNPIVFS